MVSAAAMRSKVRPNCRQASSSSSSSHRSRQSTQLSSLPRNDLRNHGCCLQIQLPPPHGLQSVHYLRASPTRHFQHRLLQQCARLESKSRLMCSGVCGRAACLGVTRWGLLRLAVVRRSAMRYRLPNYSPRGPLLARVRRSPQSSFRPVSLSASACHVARPHLPRAAACPWHCGGEARVTACEPRRPGRPSACRRRHARPP